MTPIIEKIQPPLRKNKLANRWIFIILSALLLFTITRTTPALSSIAPILGNLLVTPSPTPTATATATAITTATATAAATATSPATSTSNPTQAKTTTALATSEPTATQTMTPFATPQTAVKVSYDYVSLHSGPGANFAVAQQLPLGKPLILLGRINGNTWLYVKTSDGQEGWIKTASVNLAGINLDNHPIQTPSPSPETTVKVSANSVNLRTGPGTNFSKIQQLTFGELLVLTGRLSDNTWLYVKTSDGREGWIQTTSVNLSDVNLVDDYFPIETPPPTETSTPVVWPGMEDHWIDIDLGQQTLYAYDGPDLVASFLVSTGLNEYPTRAGQYHIYAKFDYSDMRGADYFLPDVPYTMYYDGDFSIHGTYWHHSFGTRMSHGCINMDTRDAEWIYNWAPVGTFVNIHR